MKNRIKLLMSSALLATAGALYLPTGLSELHAQTAAGNPGASAQEKAGPPHGFRRHKLARMAKELNLTEEQKAEIQSLMTAERPNIQPLVQQLAKNRQALRATIKSGHFDEAQVRTLADQQAQTMSQLIVEKARVQSKIYNVLTPEQRAKAEQLRENWKGHHSAHRNG